MRYEAPYPCPDWWSMNESDGMEFFGYDNGDGTTTWYAPDGTLDSVTATPDEDSPDVWLGTLRRL